MKFKKNLNYNTRKIHRYTGVFIGIQFLFWTVGGLYFSWNNMDDVHGESLLKQDKKYFSEIDFSKVQKGIDSLKSTVNFDSVHSINLIEAFGKPLIQFKYFKNDRVKIQLISGETGSLRPAFTEKESLDLAIKKLKVPFPVIETHLLKKDTIIGGHHEYRDRKNKPLPAYAFTLDHPTATTIYVAPELGEITNVVNNNWRRFDFLWMLHSMDFKTRDNFTNWILRTFSILGLFTILSGFMLFYLTSPTIKKIKKKKKKKIKKVI